MGDGTRYSLQLAAGSDVARVVRNHIPLDPQQAPGLVISKTGNRQIVEIGDTLEYTITVLQTAGADRHLIGGQLGLARHLRAGGRAALCRQQ